MSLTTFARVAALLHTPCASSAKIPDYKDEVTVPSTKQVAPPTFCVGIREEPLPPQRMAAGTSAPTLVATDVPGGHFQFLPAYHHLSQTQLNIPLSSAHSPGEGAFLLENLIELTKFSTYDES